jgi:hypothetical protein
MTPMNLEHPPPFGHPSREGNTAIAGEGLIPLLRGEVRSTGVCESPD